MTGRGPADGDCGRMHPSFGSMIRDVGRLTKVSRCFFIIISEAWRLRSLNPFEKDPNEPKIRLQPPEQSAPRSTSHLLSLVQLRAMTCFSISRVMSVCFGRGRPGRTRTLFLGHMRLFIGLVCLSVPRTFACALHSGLIARAFFDA